MRSGMSFYSVQPYDAETDGPVSGGNRPLAHPPVAVGASRDSNSVADAPQPPGVVWPNWSAFERRSFFIQTALDVLAIGFGLLFLAVTGFAITASIFLLFL